MESRIKFATMVRRPLQIVLATAVVFQPVFAQDANKASILQNSADQQDVRQHTTVLVTQIQSMIDELAANGITGDDLKVLQTTKAVLTNLSSKEMERVVASLQKAAAEPGTENGRQSAVDAYAGQKGIILEFHQILKDYQQRQAALELPVQFKQLTDRQTDTMWTTVEVATAAAGKSVSEMTTMQQTTAQIVATDQDSLASDVALAQQQLDKAAEGGTGDEGNAIQQAEKDLKTGTLQKALDAAAADLKAGHLLQATSEQKVARDQLRQISKDLNPATDAVTALNETTADLARVIDDQKSLLGETTNAVGVKPRPTGLDQKQGVLVDKTNSLQDDMQSLSPEASALVKEAINPMQLSRAALTGRADFAKSATDQQDALAKLEEAQKQVTQQLADAQKAADDAAKDPVAKLEDLQKQIQTAMQQQQQLMAQTAQTSNPAAPEQQQQSQLQTQTAALQQAAQPLSLPAAQALANAANQMAQAQKDLADPSTAAQAPAAQQAAQAALAQAGQVVTQQIASTQAAAPDPAALASAATSLNNAQSDVSNAIADSAPPSSSPSSSPSGSPSASPSSSPSASPSASPPGSPSASPSASPSGPPSASPSNSPAAGAVPSLPAAATALAQASQASAAAAATPGLPAAAAAAVQAAQAAIAQGETAAAQGNASAASDAAASAQTSLAQAQAAVALAQAGLPTPGAPMAGGPPGPSVPGMAPTPPAPDAPSMDGAKMVSGGSTDQGTLHDVSGNGAFITAASRDRSALGQTQSEKRPQEYAPMIDQYMKNLADQSSSSSP